MNSHIGKIFKEQAMLQHKFNHVVIIPIILKFCKLTQSGD